MSTFTYPEELSDTDSTTSTELETPLLTRRVLTEEEQLDIIEAEYAQRNKFKTVKDNTRSKYGNYWHSHLNKWLPYSTHDAWLYAPGMTEQLTEIATAAAAQQTIRHQRQQMVERFREAQERRAQEAIRHNAIRAAVRQRTQLLRDERRTLNEITQRRRQAARIVFRTLRRFRGRKPTRK